MVKNEKSQAISWILQLKGQRWKSFLPSPETQRINKGESDAVLQILREQDVFVFTVCSMRFSIRIAIFFCLFLCAKIRLSYVCAQNYLYFCPPEVCTKHYRFKGL